MFICHDCSKKIDIENICFVHEGPPQNCIAHEDCGNQAMFWVGNVLQDECIDALKRWEKFYGKYQKNARFSQIATKLQMDNIEAQIDMTVAIQYANAIKTEYSRMLAGDPVPEEEQFKNKPRCHSCGSIHFHQTGACRTCSVCGESQGCG